MKVVINILWRNIYNPKLVFPETKLERMIYSYRQKIENPFKFYFIPSVSESQLQLNSVNFLKNEHII